MTARGTRLFIIGALSCYVVLFNALSIARYETFHSTTFDLGSELAADHGG